MLPVVLARSRYCRPIMVDAAAAVAAASRWPPGKENAACKSAGEEASTGTDRGEAPAGGGLIAASLLGPTGAGVLCGDMASHEGGVCEPPGGGMSVAAAPGALLTPTDAFAAASILCGDARGMPLLLVAVVLLPGARSDLILSAWLDPEAVMAAAPLPDCSAFKLPTAVSTDCVAQGRLSLRSWSELLDPVAVAVVESMGGGADIVEVGGCIPADKPEAGGSARAGRLLPLPVASCPASPASTWTVLLGCASWRKVNDCDAGGSLWEVLAGDCARLSQEGMAWSSIRFKLPVETVE